MKSGFKLRLGNKILLYVLSTSVLILAAIGIFMQIKTYTMAERNAETIMLNYAQKEANQIKSELDLDVGFSRALAHSLSDFYRYDSTTFDSIFFNVAKKLIEQNLRYVTIWYNFEYSVIQPNYPNNYGRKSITAYLENGESKIRIEQKNMTGDNLTSDYYRAKSTNSEVILDPYPYSLDNINEFLVTSMCIPIQRGGSFVGLAGIDIFLDKFQSNVKRISPYPNTIAYLVSNNGTIVAHTNPSLAGNIFLDVYPELDAQFGVSSKIKKGVAFSFNCKDDSGERIHFFAPIAIEGTNTPWAIAMSIPKHTITAEARSSMISGLLVAILGLIALGVVLYYISNSITKPIRKITLVLDSLGKGDIEQTESLCLGTNDELEDMANSVNRLKDGLNRTSDFARKIGQGDLDAQFQLLGDKDLLGRSLLEMQKSLAHAQETESKRKEEEGKQNWATQGMALFGDILRQGTSNIHDFTFGIIQNLVSYTNSKLGGIYIINENNGEHPTLEMTACYAYDRRKYLQKTIETNEGLIGRCFQEQKTIFLTQVPEDYIKITSGLGKERPRSLIIIPLKTNDNALGVLELASFNEYQQHEVEFIEKIAESIASTIANVHINIRTAELLSKSQQQAEEMLAQEEEMRQNMEELQATQEEMELKRHEQEQIQNELFEELELFDALMQNTTDYIFFKDTNSRFRRVSKSMANLFNVSSPDELIGRTDFDFHSQEHAQKTFSEEQEVMRTLKPSFDKKVQEKLEDGHTHWVSTSRMPLLNSHGEVIGTWGISKIISD